MYRLHGIKFPFVAIARVAEYLYCLSLKEKTFSCGGMTLPYFYHFYNPTFRVERCVEIPIVLHYIKNNGGRILEVGNVLPNYIDHKHDVVDKYEISPGVINEDIVSYKSSEKYDLIVSVSTIEHVGWDEAPKDDRKIIAAMENMKKLLNPAGKIVFTVPIAYNTWLDKMLTNGSLGLTNVYYMRRMSRFGGWRQIDRSGISGVEFGKPYPCANAIAICVYDKNL